MISMYFAPKSSNIYPKMPKMKQTKADTDIIYYGKENSERQIHASDSSSTVGQIVLHIKSPRNSLNIKYANCKVTLVLSDESSP